MRKFYKKMTVVLILLFTKVFFAQAFTENFDDITTLTGSGWYQHNNSTPAGINPVWFQGNPPSNGGPFTAYNGAANAYIACNFNSTSGTGTISNWLVTPNRTFRNGDVITFYTRKYDVGQDYPDRMEVRLSTNGASTNVGSDATATGDFTTLLLSINPSLTVGGYPRQWTLYTITISGLPAPTSGRIAFRYFVTAAGPTGTNSDYIGLDNVVYTPYVCSVIALTPASSVLTDGTVGTPYSVTFGQSGGLGSATYAITSGSLPAGLALSSNGTLSGTPTTVGNYTFTVSATDSSGCSGSRTYSVKVSNMLQLVGSQVNISCNGSSTGSATVVATGGTAPYSYSWDTTPVQTASTAVNLAAGNYQVTVTDAANVSKTLSFNITEANPINVSVSGNTTCANTAATVSAIGADEFLWYNQQADVSPYFTGQIFTTSVLQTSTTYYTQGVSLSPQKVLQTTFAGGNDHRGNMFNVTAQKDLVINSFDVSPMGNTTVEVYYKEGTYIGYENNPAAWKKLGSANVVYTGSPVNITVGKLTIPAGKTYALYVTSNQAGVSLNYSNGSVGEAFSDDNMTITTGAGIEYPFSNNTSQIYTPRTWNGRINYKLIDCSGSRQAVQVTVNSTPAPTGSTTQTFNQGDQLSVLNVTGVGIKWYASASDAENHINALPATTTIVHDEIYYATQTVDGCESVSSLAVHALDQTLAAGDVDKTTILTIYPNPVHDILKISSGTKINKVVITDYSGRNVLERITKGNIWENIDVRQLSQGNYIIQIFTDQEVKALKFIKN